MAAMLDARRPGGCDASVSWVARSPPLLLLLLLLLAAPWPPAGAAGWFGRKTPAVFEEKCGRTELTVMTYNVQNWDETEESNHWIVRKEYVASAINHIVPDVLAVQEVRMRDWSGVAKTDDQAEELLALLPEYFAHVRHTAHSFANGTTEGLAVYYNTRRLRLRHQSVTTLGLNTLDLNNRICQRVGLEVAAHPGCTFEVLNTHFSYDRRQQTQNVKKLMNKLLFHPPPEESEVMQLLLGDLASDPDWTYAPDVITGKTLLVGYERQQREYVPFTDLWEAVHPSPNDAYGATYSTAEALKRCDFIMARGGVQVLNASLTGERFKQFAEGWDVPSDHHAVVAAVRFDETPPLYARGRLRPLHTEL